jgi:type II restriction enzyme
METLIPESKKYIFNNEINENIKKELLIFFKETGLKEFFESKVVKNLVDYWS